MIHSFLTYVSGSATNTPSLYVDRVGFWTFALFLATALLAYFAGKQLGGISKTTKADFIKKFTDGFFSEETRDMIMLFDYKALDFRSRDIEYSEDILTKPFPYFAINEDVVKQLEINPAKQKKILDKKYYSGFEVDDYLLGFFEDLGSYEKKGLIDIEGVYNGFDWYIDIIWNNYEIKNYTKSQTEDEKEGDDIYEDFKYIYEKCDSYGKAKLNNKWMWWWKIKWFLFKK